MASHINISCKRSKDNTEESSDRRFSAHIGFPERLYSYHIPLKRIVIFIRFVPVLYAETEVLCPHQFSSVHFKMVPKRWMLCCLWLCAPSQCLKLPITNSPFACTPRQVASHVTSDCDVREVGLTNWTQTSFLTAALCGACVSVSGNLQWTMSALSLQDGARVQTCSGQTVD